MYDDTLFLHFLQVLLQFNPYHIDSLLQLSDVCRMQEDQETARDLIGEEVHWCTEYENMCETVLFYTYIF